MAFTSAASISVVSLSQHKTTFISRSSPRQPPRRLRIRVQSEERTTNTTSSSEQLNKSPTNSANTCPTCGIPRSDMPMGCDGTGRIVGGVGALIDWWPIKAYRPCGKATEAGVRYTRRGQDIDTVLFGGGPDSNKKK